MQPAAHRGDCAHLACSPLLSRRHFSAPMCRQWSGLPCAARSGEDLTPYRAASKAILGVLQRFGTAERLGLDEVRWYTLLWQRAESLSVALMLDSRHVI